MTYSLLLFLCITILISASTPLQFKTTFSQLWVALIWELCLKKSCIFDFKIFHLAVNRFLVVKILQFIPFSSPFIASLSGRKIKSKEQCDVLACQSLQMKGQRKMLYSLQLTFCLFCRAIGKCLFGHQRVPRLLKCSHGDRAQWAQQKRGTSQPFHGVCGYLCSWCSAQQKHLPLETHFPSLETTFCQESNTRFLKKP